MKSKSNLISQFKVAKRLRKKQTLRDDDIEKSEGFLDTEQPPSKKLKERETSQLLSTPSNSNTEIHISSGNIPVINESLTVANISKTKNFQLGLADKKINRYSLFGSVVMKSIELIFRRRTNDKAHADMENEEFFDIILEILNPLYVKEDADFLRLAEGIERKIDLEKGAGLDLIPKLESIVGWEVKWNRMNKQKRKDALMYIMKQIGLHLRNEWGPTGMIYWRLLREKLSSDNKEFSMDLFLDHVFEANSEWKRIRLIMKPPTTEEIKFWGINNPPRGEQKPNSKSITTTSTPTSSNENSNKKKKKK